MITLKFEQRPVGVPGNLWLYRRIAILVVLLAECCRSGSASFKVLHFLNSIYIDNKSREEYLLLKTFPLLTNSLSSSVDPYLNRCVNYAIAYKFIEQKEIKTGFKVSLTEKGKLFVKKLKEENLTKDAFDIAAAVGKISEAEIDKLLRIKN